MLSKKVLVGILALGMLMIVGAAGTFAYFQDQATGTAKITTGNPDLVTVFNNNVYQVLGNIYLPHLVPGDNGVMNLGEIENQGTAGGNLFVSVPAADVAGVSADLHIYACNEAGAAITSVDLAHGGEVQIGTMDAKSATTGNDKFPIKIYFTYTNVNSVQTGNGASYNFPVTVSLRTTGTSGQTINVANDYYATH